MRIVVIGGGIGGLAVACLLGKAGYQVTVLEKNEQLGGRAGRFTARGFTFDTGPSWLLMPDIFERFFQSLGERMEDHLQLQPLDPSYRVFYTDTEKHIDITRDLPANMVTFEAVEAGAGQQLQAYLARAAKTYHIVTQNFLYQPGRPTDLLRPESLAALCRLPLLDTMERHVGRYVRDPRLQKILLYPSVFLGVSPAQAPATYSLLSHADFTQGVYYPVGGIYALVEALARLGRRYGVTYHTDQAVTAIHTKEGKTTGVCSGPTTYPADVVISDAGVQYTETHLLPAAERDHTARYWRKRTLAPSALLLYIGVKRRYPSLAHHNLLFSDHWQRNFIELSASPRFPTNPSLYVCAPSRTDRHVAPAGKENLFVLVPLPAGLTYSPAMLEQYATLVLESMESHMDLPGLRRHIMYQRLFSVKDFASRFNSPAGTGLGLAHTLRQSAVLRPALASKKVRGLYYVGADVHPGIGLPSVVISAERTCSRILADHPAAPPFL